MCVVGCCGQDSEQCLQVDSDTETPGCNRVSWSQHSRDQFWSRQLLVSLTDDRHDCCSCSQRSRHSESFRRPSHCCIWNQIAHIALYEYSSIMHYILYTVCPIVVLSIFIIAPQHAWACRVWFCYGKSIRLSFTLGYCIKTKAHIAKLLHHLVGAWLVFLECYAVTKFQELPQHGWLKFAIFDRYPLVQRGKSLLEMGRFLSKGGGVRASPKIIGTP